MIPKAATVVFALSRMAVVRLSAILFIIALGIWFLDFDDLIRLLGWSTISAVSLAQIPLLASFLFLSLRHAVLVRKPRAPIKRAFVAVVLAAGLNFLLPMRLSELIKATYLKRTLGIPLNNGVAAVFLERIADLVLVGTLGILAIGLMVSDQNTATYVVLMVAALILIFAFPYLRARFATFIQRIPWKVGREFLTDFYDHAENRIREGDIYIALGWGLAGWLMSFSAVAVFVSVAGTLQIGLTGCLYVFLATTIGAAIPVMPGGFGTFEGGAVIALMSLEYNFDEALILALGIRVTTMIFPLLATAILLVIDRTGISDLMKDIREMASGSS